MKRYIISILSIVCALNIMAQIDGYQITAVTKGIQDTTVYLISCNTDTIGTTKMNKGVFTFKGKVETPDVAYIRPAGTEAVIPVMLENCNFQIIANSSGIRVSGGEAQSKFDRYQALSQETSAEQQRVQQEINEALQAGEQMKVQGIQNAFGTYVEKARKKETAMFDSLTNSFVGMYILSINMMQMPREMLRERYDKFPKHLQTSPNGQAVENYLDQVERIMEGKIAPDFSLPTADGDTLTLSKVHAKVKLVDFWASWCAPCRKEVPNLVKLYKNYQRKGLEIIGVSIDDKAEAWTKAMFEDGMTWRNVSDLKGAASPILGLYGLKSIPFTVLLDADNRIVGINLRGKELQQAVDKLLN